MNLGYRAARRVGARPMTLNKRALMEKASRQANGLNDFGDPRFEEGLDRLIDSLETEDRLNGVGRFIATSHITADAARHFGLPLGRTVIVGSRIEV